MHIFSGCLALNMGKTSVLITVSLEDQCTDYSVPWRPVYWLQCPLKTSVLITVSLEDQCTDYSVPWRPVYWLQCPLKTSVLITVSLEDQCTDYSVPWRQVSLDTVKRLIIGDDLFGKFAKFKPSLDGGLDGGGPEFGIQ